MKTLILAGGFGTRLSELTNVIPKPLAEIGGIPILHHIMNHYSAYGYNEFVIALGYKGHLIKDYFLNFYSRSIDFTVSLADGVIESHSSNAFDWRVTLVDTGLNTMTGGRIKACSKYLDSTFMLTYGDGVSDVNLNNLLEHHANNDFLLTLTSVNPKSRYGLLDISESGRLNQFSEKPSLANDWVNAGFMVAEPQIFDFIDNSQTVFENIPLQTLTSHSYVGVYKHHGFWQCMDTLREKNYLEDLWSRNEAPWPQVTYPKS
jgi:glucose-1-phosphate cytidylyltransferase